MFSECKMAASVASGAYGGNGIGHPCVRFYSFEMSSLQESGAPKIDPK